MKKFNFDLKKLLPYISAIILFLVFALIYCKPVLDGKVLYAGDTMNWKGMAQEAREYKQETGETTWWTNSMFSGMPTYQITGSTPSGAFRNSVEKATRLGLQDNFEVVGLLFAYFFGFFLMLICFGVNPWLSIAGAFAMGLSSYFMLIIPAGHVTKVAAIGLLAPVVGGFYAVMRKRYWLGVPLILVYSLACITLHPQMTYYVLLMMCLMGCAELYIHISEKRYKDLGISLAILLACALLVLGTKMSWLDMNNSYLKETMRGGHSELTKETDAETSSTNSSSGLDIKYATDWSYGIGETMTLLIPNWEGGASGYDLGKDSQLSKDLRSIGVPKNNAEQFCQHAPTYHGEKMFTSGPVYVGAIICFLFILALLIVPGAYKWALLVATLMSIFLAWGRNMMWLTEFFFYHFPMYNKFRAVESILVVAEITMPLLAFMGLQRIVEGKVEHKRLKISLFIAGIVTAGICLAVALFANSFDMTSSYDEEWKAQLGNDIYKAILRQRSAMVSADAWRSLMFVILGFALVYWYVWQQNKTNKKVYSFFFFAGLAVLILADMVPVDKRFFNDTNFVNKKDSDRYFAIQPWEEQILQDKDLDYRVLNLNANTFNDSRTSYRLKSIGGYHAAKLRRYQDLIDQHLRKKNWNVINMLNAKYIITAQGVMPNPNAMGNAWFVNEVQFVNTPDEECEALNYLNLKQTAVADVKFKDILSCEPMPQTEMAEGADQIDTDVITLTAYSPNRLDYQVSTRHDRVAIFSEIYYPDGWHLYIDGTETAIGRANYTLRAVVIPAGEHTIYMEFKPKALQIDKWSYAIAILIIVLSIGCITWPLWRKLRKTNASKI